MSQHHPILTAVTILSVAWSSSFCRAQDAPAPSSAPAAPSDQAKDMAAIRSAIEAYVVAFNAADAAAVAKCWGASGDYLTPEGVRLTGPEAIERHFAEQFAENSGMQLVVTVDSLRLLGDDVAIEEGTASVGQEGVAEEKSSYVAVHHKHDGVWKLETVRETVVPEESAADNPLQVLSWLVGEWSDNSLPGVQVDSSYRWAREGQFLVNTFRVVIEDQIDLEGTQIIGWDPSRQMVRSWMFDSDGGFGEGFWTQGEADEDWSVETHNVMPDGRLSSSVNRFSRVDDDLFTWSSTERKVEDEQLPDVAPIAVRRAGTED